MSALIATNSDRYRRPTDEVRSRLIDDSVEALGHAAWMKTFDIDPEFTRSSIDCVKTRWYTDWGVLVCNYYPTARKISKELIDKLKWITDARNQEIKRHELNHNPTPREKISTERHRYFNKRLEDLKRMLATTFEQVHGYERHDSSALVKSHEVQMNFQRLAVDGLNEREVGLESVSRSNSPSPDREERIRSDMGAEARKDDTTQGDIDSNRENSLEQYCEDVAQIRSAVLEIWGRHAQGR
jgi:hypothetical protein